MMHRIGTLLVALSLVAAACGGGGSDETDEPAVTTTVAEGVETTAAVDITIPETSSETSPDGEQAACPEGELCRIELATTDILLGFDPAALALDGSTAWITGPDTGLLMAVDLGGGTQLKSTTLDGAPGPVAVGAEGVWVASSGFDGNQVRLVDPETLEVTAEVEPDAFRNAGDLAVADDGGLWASIDATGEVVHIDPNDGGVVASVVDYDNQFAGNGADILTAFGKVWVVDAYAGRVLAIDPATNQITDRIDQLGFAAEESDGTTTILAAGPLALAADDTSVWVASSTENPDGEFVVGYGALFRIDPVSGSTELVAELTLQPAPGSPGLAVGSDAVWFIDATSGQPVRVDQATGREAVIELGLVTARGLVVHAGTVWVLLGGFGTDARLTGIAEIDAAAAFTAATGG
jgi:streptogramin lyase